MPPSVDQLDVYIEYDTSDQISFFMGASTRTPSDVYGPLYDADYTSFEIILSASLDRTTYNLTGENILAGTFYFRADYFELLNATFLFQYNQCSPNNGGYQCSSPFIPLNSTNAGVVPANSSHLYYIDISSMQEFNITFTFYGHGSLLMRKNGFPLKIVQQNDYVSRGYIELPYTDTVYFPWQATYVGGRYIFSVENFQNSPMNYTLDFAYWSSKPNSTTTTTTTTGEMTTDGGTTTPFTSSDAKISSCIVAIFALVLLIA